MTVLILVEFILKKVYLYLILSNVNSYSSCQVEIDQRSPTHNGRLLKSEGQIQFRSRSTVDSSTDENSTNLRIYLLGKNICAVIGSTRLTTGTYLRSIYLEV